MGWKKIFIILLLAIFGLNIFGDFLSRAYSESNSSEHIFSTASMDVISSADSFNQAGSQDCNDVSGSGHCHFGHCSHVYFPGLFNFNRSSILENSIVRLVEHNSPFLEGFKRPPRMLS